MKATFLALIIILVVSPPAVVFLYFYASALHKAMKIKEPVMGPEPRRLLTVFFIFFLIAAVLTDLLHYLFGVNTDITGGILFFLAYAAAFWLPHLQAQAAANSE